MTKTSTHFEVGTYVVHREMHFGRWEVLRAEVISRPGDGYMMVRNENDGTTSVLYPQALSHERVPFATTTAT